MKTIALSGIQNTGKSTLLKTISDHFSSTHRVHTLPETARQIIENSENPIENRTLADRQNFQIQIRQQESLRLEEIRNLITQNSHDLLLIDRSCSDNAIFAEFMNQKGERPADRELPAPLKFNYDAVILLTEQIKPSSKNPIFDEKSFADLFRQKIPEIYPHAWIFRNGMRDSDEIIQKITEILENS